MMESEKKQYDLFNEPIKEDWEKEWKDMPEFVQDDLSSYKKLIIHFRNQEDLENFSKLIDQKINIKTPSIWYPKLKIRHTLDKVYT